MSYAYNRRKKNRNLAKRNNNTKGKIVKSKMMFGVQEIDVTEFRRKPGVMTEGTN